MFNIIRSVLKSTASAVRSLVIQLVNLVVGDATTPEREGQSPESESFGAVLVADESYIRYKEDYIPHPPQKEVKSLEGDSLDEEEYIPSPPAPPNHLSQKRRKGHLKTCLRYTRAFVEAVALTC